MSWLINGLIYLGALLMVYNIWGFVRYARLVGARGKHFSQTRILYFPIFLLVMFLLGYLAVCLFGHPDWIVAGILFGGSVFVFIIYLLLSKITQQIIASERLEAELIAAEQSARARDAFLASVSHEMRTPMNVILGLDAVALRNPDLPEDTREQLEQIGYSGKHLLDLINNTLDMQGIETGALAAREEPFSLREIVNQVNAVAGPLCQEKGLAYVPSMNADPKARLLGDALLLKEALLVLLDNAVKFTNPPGTVRFTADTPGDQLRFTVEDTGIGMSPEFLPKAFDLFSREDPSSKSRYGGSGMGLAVAREKAGLMGGSISVVSKKGEGTVFTLTLPLRPAPEEPPKVFVPDPFDLSGCRILLAEDIPANAEIAIDLLDLEGMVCDHAENGQVALDMFRGSIPYEYDAVLMDLRMPVMDGLEAARAIRALNRPDAGNIPILAVTANAFDSDIRASLEAGMNAHLVKPIDANLLYDSLRHWIRIAREGRTDE